MPQIDSMISHDEQVRCQICKQKYEDTNFIAKSKYRKQGLLQIPEADDSNIMSSGYFKYINNRH